MTYYCEIRTCSSSGSPITVLQYMFLGVEAIDEKGSLKNIADAYALGKAF